MNIQPTLLVVDDNPGNRLAIRTVLKNVTTEIEEASNGFDAISMSLEKDYALVLLDVRMPDMDGFEVCEQLRANPRTAKTPVIFVSEAYKSIEDNIRGYVAGATDYLLKPIHDHILRSKVQVFLRLYLQQAQLHQANEELRIAAAAFETQEGVCVTDTHGVILRVNRAFTELTGYSPQEVLGRTPAILKSGRHNAEFYRHLWNTLKRDNYWQGEIWNCRKNGEIFPEWLTITAVVGQDGAITHFVGNFTDITRHKQAEEQILQLAFYDSLTQLPNRRLLFDRLSQALTASARSQHYGAVLYIDLDQFKTLNDTSGHVAGDLLLIEVAKRLRSCVRDGDTVARLGGDEFMVVLERLGDDRELSSVQAKLIGEKILEAINRPYRINDRDHYGTASMGIALFDGRNLSVDELLKYSDTALYEAKNAGRNTLRFFDPAMQAALEARIVLETDLRCAISQGELQLYYQPQIDDANRLIGAEALLRWTHPERGIVGPSHFIPLAEETGLIVPIGLRVLQAACAQIEKWKERYGEGPFQISVNVSARQFRHPDFVRSIRETLEKSGIDSRRLKLELTESLLLDNVEDAIKKMALLKSLGISFSIDDFGTGYSSLSYLKRLPLDDLKIDRSFIRDFDHDPSDAVLVQTIIGMGHNLGLTVIAEGVETRSQLEFLIKQGCHTFQGHLFGHPMTAKDFQRFWDRSDTRVPVTTHPD